MLDSSFFLSVFKMIIFFCIIQRWLVSFKRRYKLLKSHIFIHTVIISSSLHSFVDAGSLWYHLSSFWRIPFIISCNAGLLVMNSFIFCLFEKVFILPLLLKDIFSGYRILGWFLFTFSTLKMLFQCLLPCIVCNEKSAIALTFVSLYICVSFL